MKFKTLLNCCRKLIITLVVGPFLIVPRTLLADEIFHQPPDKMPVSVAKVWDSTFFMLSEDSGRYSIGSAVLAKVQKNSKDDVLYFVTNNHLVPRSCKVNKPCAGLKFFQESKMHPTPKEFATAELLTSGESFEKIQVTKRNQDRDLVLLKVVVKRAQLKSKLLPVELPRKCDLAENAKVYAVGFPQLENKPTDASHPVADQEYLRKRWNEALYVKMVGVIIGRPKLAATTNFSFDGSFGGPLVNEAGQLVGIVEGGTANPLNNFEYSGSEVLKDKDWSTIAIPCSDVTKLLGM